MRYENDSVEALQAEIIKLKADVEQFKFKLTIQQMQIEQGLHLKLVMIINFRLLRADRSRSQINKIKRKWCNCIKTEHIARFCKERVTGARQCCNCGENHLIRFCTQRRLCNLDEDEFLEGSLGNSRQAIVEIEGKKLSLISASQWTVQKTRKIINRQPTFIESTVQLIVGHYEKHEQMLRHLAETVIS